MVVCKKLIVVKDSGGMKARSETDTKEKKEKATTKK